MNHSATHDPFAGGGKPPLDPASPYLHTGPPVVSSLAIISLVFGLLSPLMLCVCGLSLLTSLVAVVTGHVAILKIGNSAGQLTGRGLALAGLISGYLMLAISVVALIVLLPSYRHDWRHRQEFPLEVHPPSRDAAQRLLDAEASVTVAGSEGVATGNSSAAISLAENYAVVLKSARDALFTEDDSLIAEVTGGDFVTHCELHDGRCAFIVHVPAYRKFDDDAKETLASVAWSAAQLTVANELGPGDRLAVALRGRLIYGAVMIGQIASDDIEDEEDNFRLRERDDLLPFFLPSSDDSSTGAVREEPQAGPQPGAQSRTPSPPLASPAPCAASPPATPVPQRTRPRVPAPPRPSPPAPRRPQWTDDVPVSQDVVQTFPDLGWAVESLAFMPDGRWLAAGKLDRTLLILDIQTGETLSAVKKLDELSSLKTVVFSPDGKFVTAGGSTGAVFSWTISREGILADAQSLVGQRKSVECLSISPSSPFLMTGSADGELLWQSLGSTTSTSRKLQALPRGALASYVPQEGVEALASDGRQVVRVDWKTASVIAKHELRQAGAQSAAFSHDGSRLAVTAGYEIHVYETTTGESLGSFRAGNEMQWTAAFVPGQQRLISGGRGFATLWNLETGKPECRFDLGGVLYIQTLVVSPDGTLVAAIPAAAGQTLTVFRIPE